VQLYKLMKKMLRYLFKSSGLAILSAMLLTACAVPQLNSVWKDPAYQTRPARIMVIGVARKPLDRRIFEDEFVLQLKARGTEAIASYTILPGMQQNDREAIAAKVKELGADTVLITRLVSRSIRPISMQGAPYVPPPFHLSWPDYYGNSYVYMYTTDYVALDEYAVLEANLYEARSDKLIWAASSETGISDADLSAIRGYISIMVKNMIGLGLLGK
jgi:hypothetical protein